VARHHQQRQRPHGSQLVINSQPASATPAQPRAPSKVQRRLGLGDDDADSGGMGPASSPLTPGGGSTLAGGLSMPSPCISRWETSDDPGVVEALASWGTEDSGMAAEILRLGAASPARCAPGGRRQQQHGGIDGSPFAVRTNLLG
jgi:hypothetical protein